MPRNPRQSRATSQVSRRSQRTSQRTPRQSVIGPWTQAEDAQLKFLVGQFGTGRVRWNQVAQGMQTDRSGKQCRERWVTQLDPRIDHSPITAEEGAIIFQLREDIGPKWSTMVRYLPGRTDNAIKNYWNKNKNGRKHKPTQSRVPSRANGPPPPSPPPAAFLSHSTLSAAVPTQHIPLATTAPAYASAAAELSMSRADSLARASYGTPGFSSHHGLYSRSPSDSESSFFSNASFIAQTPSIDLQAFVPVPSADANWASAGFANGWYTVPNMLDGLAQREQQFVSYDCMNWAELANIDYSLNLY